ncbi:hypothetical protein L6R29_14935 [Myxococcota bacterium]|nr:hypothetical protein [Myxococcota bacterium]
MRRRWFWLVGFVMLWGGACAPKAKLQLTLFYPYGDDGKAAYAQIKGFRIKVSGASLTDGPVSADFDTTSGLSASVLGDVKCGKEKAEQLDLQVHGLDGAGKVVAMGRQTILNPCGAKRDLSVFVAPVEVFSSLTKYEGGATVPEQMLKERAGHQMRQLSDGRLLISGGFTFNDQGGVGGVSNRIEIFDPETGRISDGIPMSEPRAFHSITVSQNTVLIAGGIKFDDATQKLVSVRSVDIFELTAEGLTKKSSFEMAEPKGLHSALITPSMNHILIFGGIHYQADGSVIMAKKWEIFDVKGSPIGTGDIPLDQQRAWHSATLLGDGRPFFAGGIKANAQGDLEALSSVLSLQYSSDDATVTLIPLPTPLKAARAAHTATKLLDGQIVIVGGMVPEAKDFLRPKSVVGSIQMFTALGEENTQYNGALKQARAFHSAHLLEDGRLLIYGGSTGATSLADRTEIYTPEGLGLSSDPLLVMQRKDRFLHAATVLLNGALVVFGGATLNPEGPSPFLALSRGEVFLPRPKP